MSKTGSFILTWASLLALAGPWLVGALRHVFPGVLPNDSTSPLVSLAGVALGLGAQLGVFGLLIGASTLGYNGWGSSRYFAGQEYAHARCAFMLGLALHIIAAYFAIPFFLVEHGASIRPMMLPMVWLFLVFVSFFAVLPLTFRVGKHDIPSVVPFMCLVVGFSPIATSISLFTWAQNLRQFTLAH
jgi:hypothetical protein